MRHFKLPPFFLPSASLDKRKKLPKTTGVYYVIQWWQPWKLLYVGRAEDFRTRWYDHHKTSELQSMFGVRVHCRRTRNVWRARRLEAIEIQRYKPTLNKRNELHQESMLHDICDAFVDGLWMTLAIIFVAAIYYSL